MDKKDQLPLDFSHETVSKAPPNKKGCESVSVSVLSLTSRLESKKQDYEASLYSRIVARAKHLL